MKTFRRILYVVALIVVKAVFIDLKSGLIAESGRMGSYDGARFIYSLIEFLGALVWVALGVLIVKWFVEWTIDYWKS